MRRLTPKQLRAWRLGQRHTTTGEPLTQKRVAFLVAVSARAWQHWEAGTRQIPGWLSAWIRAGTLTVPDYAPKGASHG